MKGFDELYTAGRIKRWHTSDLPAQQLSEHSWGVAMIVCRIVAHGDLSSDLIMAALVHDLAESTTGDVPAHIKWDNPDMGRVLDKLENDFNTRHKIKFSLTDLEEHILRWADTFELCLYADHQRELGNKYANVVLKRGLGRLRYEMGFPTPESKDLYHEFFSE